MSDLVKRLCRPGYDLQKEQAIQEAIIEIRELRAKIEAMEKQEPYCWTTSPPSGYHSGFKPEVDRWIENGWIVVPLYARPGAQPAPSALAEAIIADMQAQHDSELITENDSGEALIRLDGAIAAVEDNFALAQPAPIIPEAVMEVIAGLVYEVERNVCTHEETHRGGFLWEICDMCGARWADDMGGKPEFKWPEIVEKARDMLAAATEAKR